MPSLSPSEPASHSMLDRGPPATRSSESQLHGRGSESRDYAIFWLDLNGNVTRWSDDCESLFGYGRTGGLKTTFADYFLAEDRSRGFPESVLRSARAAGSWDGSGWRIAADDRAFWAACSVTHVSTPNGLEIGYMVVTHDMTRLLSDGADEFLGEGAGHLLSLGRVASDVSHDMRNILSAIRGFAGLLERHLPDGGMPHQAWYELLKACDRGSALTDRLLETGRARTEEDDVVDLPTVLRGVEPLLRQLLPDRITLGLVASESVPLVRLRASEVELVLLNLVVNARDAISGEGSVAILANAHRSEGASCDFVSLVVRDDGCGMTPTVLERAVDRSYTTKAPGVGTGLGLALVRETVSKSGGTMTMDSAAGRGTMVTLKLPVASPVSSRVAPIERTSRRGRALVCCDSPVLEECVAELLRRDGFEVQRVCCAEADSVGLIDGSQQLVLLEDGCDLWHAVQKARETGASSTPTICFVGAESDHSRLADQSAIDRTLEWPFAPDELLVEARELVEQPRRSAIN